MKRLFRWLVKLFWKFVKLLVIFFFYISPALFCPAPEIRFGDECLPEANKGRKHDDFWFFLGRIPRSHTSACSLPAPTLLLGQPDIRSANGIKPVPLRGIAQLQTQTIPTKMWSVVLLNLTLTTKTGIHLRAGMFRWDDVDNHHTFPSAARRYDVPEFNFEEFWDKLLWHHHQL